MRIEFEATLEDVQHVTYYSWVRAGILRSSAWAASFFWGLMFGVGMFSLYPALSPLLDIPDSLPLQLFAGVTTFLGFGLLWYIGYPEMLKNTIGKQCKTLLGAAVPFRVVVSLSPEGVRVEQLGTTFVHDWSIVESLDETERSFIFVIRYGHIVGVPYRAFPSSEELDDFEGLVQQYLEQSRSGQGHPPVILEPAKEEEISAPHRPRKQEP